MANDNYTDNLLYGGDILSKFILLLTLKVPLHLLTSPKDKNEELLFSKLQIISFSLIKTVPCCDPTDPKNSTNV